MSEISRFLDLKIEKTHLKYPTSCEPNCNTCAVFKSNFTDGEIDIVLGIDADGNCVMQPLSELQTGDGVVPCEEIATCINIELIKIRDGVPSLLTHFCEAVFTCGIPPLVCSFVDTCINDELIKIGQGEPSELPAFCDAVLECVGNCDLVIDCIDSELMKIANDIPSELEYFCDAVAKCVPPQDCSVINTCTEAELQNIASGSPTMLPSFCQAVKTCLPNTNYCNTVFLTTSLTPINYVPQIGDPTRPFIDATAAFAAIQIAPNVYRGRVIVIGDVRLSNSFALIVNAGSQLVIDLHHGILIFRRNGIIITDSNVEVIGGTLSANSMRINSVTANTNVNFRSTNVGLSTVMPNGIVCSQQNGFVNNIYTTYSMLVNPTPDSGNVFSFSGEATINNIGSSVNRPLQDTIVENWQGLIYEPTLGVPSVFTCFQFV